MKKFSPFFCIILLLVNSFVFAGPQDKFWEALMQCNLDDAKKWVSKGADPKAMHSSGQNSLALAYFCPDVTKYLIAEGVDPNSDGGNALIGAANNYSYEVMKLLLDAGADPNGKTAIYGDATPVTQVIKQTNCVPCLELLRDAGADLTPTFEKESNYIHTLAIFSMTKEQRKQQFAAAKPGMEAYGLKIPDWYGNLGDDRNGKAEEILDILIAAGNDMNKQLVQPEIKYNAKGEGKETGEMVMTYSPLMMAIGIATGGSTPPVPGKHHIAEALLERGCDVTQKTQLGYTALALAAGQDNPKLTKMLLDQGADITTEVWLLDPQSGLYMKGATPFIIAAKYGRLENCKLLLEAGSKITKGVEGAGKTDKGCFYRIVDKSGLYFAIETGNAELVQFFLDNHKFWNNNTMKYIQPDQTSKTDMGSVVIIDKTCRRVKGPIRPNMHASSVGQKEISKLLIRKGL